MRIVDPYAELLDQQSEEWLLGKITELESQVGELQAMMAPLREAIRRKSGRSAPVPQEEGVQAGAGAALSKRDIKREEVFSLTKDGREWTPETVKDAFRERGVNTTEAAMKQALRRLHREGQLVYHSNGSYQRTSNPSKTEGSAPADPSVNHGAG